MNSVGIDVSKGKSMVAAIQPFGVIVISPFEVAHIDSELSNLAKKLRDLPGETKVIMECTSIYYLPVAHALRNAGLTVCAVHAQLVHGFGNNTIRKTKTDKADALKIANYGLSNWLDLPEFVPNSDIRYLLKSFSRQYNKYNKLKTTLKNNLISLLDQTFPNVNNFFACHSRKSDGHEKWVDFVDCFWHCECVTSLSKKAFATAYRKWCIRKGYRFSSPKVETIYMQSFDLISVMPMNDSVKTLIRQAVTQICAVSETLASLSSEMNRLAVSLSEYPVVIEFCGVGELLCPQLIAEIGDIYRFPKKSSLVRFAGLEPVEHKSGIFCGKERISKQGPPHLRKTLFQVMDCLLKHSPSVDPVFQFLNRKRAEGKNYFSYMTAGSAKFLRIYYARVKQFLELNKAI